MILLNMEPGIIDSLAIVLLVSAFSVFILQKLKLPSIVGFLISGVIIGPNGLAFVHDTREIETMAEIGVVLLLFAIGIEFSLSRLIKMKRTVIGGGTLQVFLTGTLTAIFALLWTANTKQAIFMGFLVALSSTAIVLKIISERGELDSPYGRFVVGVLIFQDLCVVPFMLLAPALRGAAVDITAISLNILRAAIIVITVLVGAKWIVPMVLRQVVRTRNRELFITTIMLFCIGIAVLTSKFGLSLALGAFLAGLIISDSEYAYQAISDIVPFKESFMGLFFVSIGMLMDTNYLLSHASTVALAVIMILIVKIASGTFSAAIIGMPVRASLQGGLNLAQIGEFSFVLALTGKSLNIIDEDIYQLFLSSSVITMVMAPFALKYSSDISVWVTSRNLLARLAKIHESSAHMPHAVKKHGHVIIIGFGLNGRNLARVLKASEIPYVILEMNGNTVNEMKKKGEPIYYGDGTSLELLHKLGIERARILVIAISDAISTRRTVSIAKSIAPQLFVIARTRYLAELDELKALGADDVIPEEFETSIEIFSRVLGRYLVPADEILEMTRSIRTDNYRALRNVHVPKKLFEHADIITDIEFQGHRIATGSPLIGKSIAEIKIRSRTGSTVIGVKREDEVYTNPSPSFVFQEGDIVLFTGDSQQIAKALQCMREDMGSCPPVL